MRMKLAIIMGAILLASAPNLAVAQCGNFNGDPYVDVQDVVAFVEYLWNGGPPPAVYSDMDLDDHLVVTQSDLMRLLRHLYVTPGLSCPPTQPKIAGPVSPSHVLSWEETTSGTNMFPAGATSGTIEFLVTTGTPFVYLDLPMVIDVGGQTPTIGTITINPTMNSWSNLGQSYGTSGSGKVVLSYGDYTGGAIGPLTNQPIATVDISFASAPGNLPINVNWDWTCPPVDILSGESSHYPLLIVSFAKNSQLEAYQPTLAYQHGVPSMTGWGAILLSALLTITGLWFIIRRRRAVA